MITSKKIALEQMVSAMRGMLSDKVKKKKSPGQMALSGMSAKSESEDDDDDEDEKRKKGAATTSCSELRKLLGMASKPL